jgi:uncharacterized membrane protein
MEPPTTVTDPRAARKRWLPVTALILLALIWGYSWVVMKTALNWVEPFTFAALRTFPGGVLLLTVLLLQKRPVRPKALGSTLILGLMQTTGFVGLLTWALQGGGAGKTSILTYSMPFWLLLMAWVVLGERLKGFHWVAVGLALCGLILILTPWRLEGNFSDFLAVGGALLWAGSAVWAKVLRKRHEVDLLSLTVAAGLHPPHRDRRVHLVKPAGVERHFRLDFALFHRSRDCRRLDPVVLHPRFAQRGNDRAGLAAEPSDRDVRRLDTTGRTPRSAGGAGHGRHLRSAGARGDPGAGRRKKIAVTIAKIG